MKNNTHSVRQIVCSCISMLLTALLTVLTYLDPEQVPLAPLLVRMLLLPGLLLVIAGVNFCCLKTGICKLFTGKPDRHTTAVLTVLLAFVLSFKEQLLHSISRTTVAGHYFISYCTYFD